MSKKKETFHIDMKLKRTLKGRTDLANVIAKQAPNSSFVQNNPPVKAACDEVIKAGTELEDADTAVHTAEATLAAARTAREEKVKNFDAACDFCVAQTEFYATTAKDAESVGYTILDPTPRPLVPPNKVDAYFDAAANVIRIEIEQPKGMRSCVVEISTDPNVPGSWHAIDGTGMRRKLAGYAPGTYWIRAANQRAKAKSTYTTPVMVVVK